MLAESHVEVDQVGRSLWVVSLLGEHDLATATELDAALALIDEPTSQIVVDLTGATFIDSSIIGTLTRHSTPADGEDGERIVIVAPHGSAPRQVLNLVRVAIPLFATKRQALLATDRVR